MSYDFVRLFNFAQCYCVYRAGPAVKLLYDLWLIASEHWTL